ncbi:hypothetical protein AB205_0179490 [Aquarana catesbeiana]|uniref:PH domain-containing protein n=1 Tax=Aquarana catesbeiana TaxID=8400 RepID=A0A2G9SD69_AQUCT|nr:hypothetical protein AB205_0179490 [Aquarana catesbeiana]
MLDQLHVEQCDSEEPTSPPKNSTPILYSRQCSASHLFTLTIHSNHVAEKVEMLLGAETLSDRARWITALGQSTEKPCTDRTRWYEGERLRDGERGWFPMECAKEITCRATLEKNMERMGRLLALETNV